MRSEQALGLVTGRVATIVFRRLSGLEKMFRYETKVVSGLPIFARLSRWLSKVPTFERYRSTLSVGWVRGAFRV